VASQRLIDIRGVTKIFRSDLFKRPKHALCGVDLSVEEGEIFGFLGPNGAGKTTTIKILLGLIRPTSGQGTLLGRRFGSVAARQDLGFLPDSPNFHRYLTARELLEFHGRLHGLAGADLAGRIDEVLERVRLAPEARGRQLRTFSRGMLQRTGIAAAILHRPRLVILDEPMNGLDPLGRHQFRDLILQLKGEGATVLLSSHVLADIESTADRVAILHEGRVVRCGALDDILSREGRAVEIHFEVDPSAIPALNRELDALRPGSRGWIGLAGDPEEATRMVRAVLDAGGCLLGYQPHRITLEEFFVQQIADSTASGEPSSAPSSAPAPASGPATAPAPSSSAAPRPGRRTPTYPAEIHQVPTGLPKDKEVRS
jgi:ABC-2 type transport system ATP-binding protein